MKDNLIKKFLSFSYGSGVGLIIGIFTTMFITRILSPEDFGKFSMFTLATSICMIFVIFGTDQAFVRFYYEECKENRGGLLYNCFKTPIGVALVTSLVILFLYKPISIFLFEEEEFEFMLMLVILIVIQAIYRYAVLVIRMQQKGHLFSLLEILNRAFQFFFIILLHFFLGASYEIVIYSTVITYIILTIVAIIYEREFWDYKNFSSKKLKHSKLEILKYSYPLVLTTLITWLFQSIDKVSLRHWTDFQELGLYAAAFKIVALLNVVQVGFSMFWTPVCYERFEKDPHNTSFYERMFKIVAIGMFLITIITISFKDIIILLLGEAYREAAYIMPFLVFMPLMYTLSETTVIGINFYKKPKWHILIAIVSCLTNITGNFYLVPKYGAIGAAISTAFSYVVFFSIRTSISLKYYKVNYGLKKAYFMFIIIALFAMYSSYNGIFIRNIKAGIIPMLILIVLYYRELTSLYRNYSA
ncbi:oligosaccharide flippase family protein [Desulfosporosinus sp.]|uniref:lipopolysaccharide biosynthesis protein n=1 Tax=Desulfosporosinus sp. TaxID=157907 RepID=UPI0025BB53DF|nr:oligosaccharide flippase family protein [Desulfosporosinus sp.]MBC2726064.1 oligosaccharide flippase family protein [Desulfosporosinus sp.]